MNRTAAIWIAALFGALVGFAIGAAGAQDTSPWYRDGGIVVSPRYVQRNFIVNYPGPAAMVSSDGEVRIDWVAVEKIAADPAQHDPTTRAIVLLMLAIRDGTYKSMEK